MFAKERSSKSYSYKTERKGSHEKYRRLDVVAKWYVKWLNEYHEANLPRSYRKWTCSGFTYSILFLFKDYQSVSLL